MYDYWYECMCEHTLYGRGARVSMCVKVSIGANVSACMSVGRGVSINMK